MADASYKDVIQCLDGFRVTYTSLVNLVRSKTSNTPQQPTTVPISSTNNDPISSQTTTSTATDSVGKRPFDGQCSQPPVKRTKTLAPQPPDDPKTPDQPTIPLDPKYTNDS